MHVIGPNFGHNRPAIMGRGTGRAGFQFGSDEVRKPPHLFFCAPMMVTPDAQDDGLLERGRGESKQTKHYTFLA